MIIIIIILPRVPYYLKLQVKLKSGSKTDFLFSYMHMHVIFMWLLLKLLHQENWSATFHFVQFVLLSTNTVMFCKFQTIPEIHFFCLIFAWNHSKPHLLQFILAYGG